MVLYETKKGGSVDDNQKNPVGVAYVYICVLRPTLPGRGGRPPSRAARGQHRQHKHPE